MYKQNNNLVSDINADPKIENSNTTLGRLRFETGNGDAAGTKEGERFKFMLDNPKGKNRDYKFEEEYVRHRNIGPNADP